MSQFTYCCSPIFDIHFILLATFKFILFLISNFSSLAMTCLDVVFFVFILLEVCRDSWVTLSKFGKFLANFFYASSALFSLINPSRSPIVCLFYYLFLSTNHFNKYLFSFYFFLFIFGFFVVIQFIYFFVFSLFQVYFLCVLQLTWLLLSCLQIHWFFFCCVQSILNTSQNFCFCILGFLFLEFLLCSF